MALSMDEQRMLAEIERRLAAEDPGLASNLTSFRKPGRLSVLRSTRARVIGSLFTVIVVAMVSLMVYAMLPFRSGARTTGNHPVTTTSSTNSGPARIGAGPGKSSAAKAATGQTSASAQTSASHGASAVSKSSPSARSSEPAVAQSGGTSAAAVHSP
jgi:cytoskeletal protein RodZ